ncbi:MAG: hypothetical protein OXF39_05160 [Nitrospira sp.]|nr:hypothetical protein [Nitrospira sp.]
MMKRSLWSLVIVASGILFMNGTAAYAEPRTESICNLGMVKGEQGRTCEVPIPSGCTVANFPGYDDPWVDVSRGGKTSCAIDEDKTDWKTRIVGSCGPCGTDNCSARFSVMFTCGDSQPMVTQPKKIYKD